MKTMSVTKLCIRLGDINQKPTNWCLQCNMIVAIQLYDLYIFSVLLNEVSIRALVDFLSATLVELSLKPNFVISLLVLLIGRWMPLAIWPDLCRLPLVVSYNPHRHRRADLFLTEHIRLNCYLILLDNRLASKLLGVAGFLNEKGEGGGTPEREISKLVALNLRKTR